jgi:hypothetical protein
MAYIEYNFADGVIHALAYDAIYKQVHRLDYEPVEGATTSQIAVPLAKATGGRLAKDKSLDHAVLSAETTFLWPGGSFDKGEIPRGKIESIDIYDADGLAIVQISHLSLTFKQLLQSKSGNALEKLIFSGDDEMAEYSGSQPIYGWGGKDTILITTVSALAHGGNGNDTISSRNYTETGTNRLYGDAGNDRINGSDSGDEAPGTGLDKLYGGTGNDKIYGRGGRDILDGGDGNDLVLGGRGADVLTGGKGKDIFDFAFESSVNVIKADSGLAPAGRDVITDLVHGADKIRLSPTVAADFVFNGQDAFSATNQIRFETSDDGVTVFVNVDSDLDADFAIELKGITSVNAADFGL